MRAAGRSQLVVGMILAWAVIYLIHVFAFPVYDGGSRAPSGGSLAALEGALCGRHRAPVASRGSRRRHRCPPAGIATAWPAGRTGNLISEYASLWAVSRRTGLESYAPPCLLNPLTSLFSNLSIPSLARVRHCRARWTTLVHDLRTWNHSSQALVLPAHTLLSEEILPQLNELKRELKFVAGLRERAQDILRDINASLTRDARPVYVGVHVRRTDYARYLRRTLNAAPAPVSFYLRAMEIFERRFPTATFLIVSDDPHWCESKLRRGRERVHVIQNDSPDAWEDEESDSARAGLDLAVLAACNHSIFDYGMFGLWGALLAGGETIVYHVSAAHAAVKIAKSLPSWELLPSEPSPPLSFSKKPVVIA